MKLYMYLVIVVQVNVIKKILNEKSNCTSVKQDISLLWRVERS